MLAHASGFTWDEALLVAAPLVVIGFLLTLARRRIRRHGAVPAPASDPLDVRPE